MKKGPVKINLMNHRGDQVIATYDPAVTESVEVAQEALTAFLDECVVKHGPGGCPPVWGRRCGETEYGPIKVSDLPEVDDVVLQRPLAGG